MSVNQIAVSDVTKRYGAFEALKDFTLKINPGEIFGLLGSNGAGKSTLMKLLVGLLTPNEGWVRVLGVDPARDHSLRHQIGYMPQQAALYDDLSARDNVRFFGRAHALADLEKRVDEVLAFTDLRDRERDLVGHFSGGMKQRVSLACALVHQPKLLLLDEPTAGVDPKLREAFWARFRELAGQGVTLLVSTHQMDEALHCDRVAVLRAGKILACDTPYGLLSRGRAEIHLWHGSLEQVETLDNYPEKLPELLGIQDQIDRIEVRQQTLEEIVLRLIQDEAPAQAAQ